MQGVVLAAGQGVRMKSELPKVLFSLCGQPMVRYAVVALRDAGVAEPVVVVGEHAAAIEAVLGPHVRYARQPVPQGTGDALRAALPLLPQQGDLLVTCADMPLLTGTTLTALAQWHQRSGAAITVLTAQLPNPQGYGRLVRDEGKVVAIVEEKDADPAQKQIHEVNTGVYCFRLQDVRPLLGQLTAENAQGEYYLTDLVAGIVAQGGKVETLAVEDLDEAIGVNDRWQLAQVQQRLQQRILRAWALQGVSLLDPGSTYIDATVQLAPEVTLLPGVVLEGETTVASGCVLGPNLRATDSHFEEGVRAQYAVLDQASVGRRAQLGPFCYLRPGSVIGADVKIGDFVEIKNSTIGSQSKVPHLTYVGDARLGERVNMGCGSITVNFDGVNKHETIIGNDVFVGCNVNLIAPVQVQEGAYLAAGSTITDDVPKQALAIARQRQVNKEGYAAVLQKKHSEQAVGGRESQRGNVP